MSSGTGERVSCLFIFCLCFGCFFIIAVEVTESPLLEIEVFIAMSAKSTLPAVCGLAMSGN